MIESLEPRRLLAAAAPAAADAPTLPERLNTPGVTLRGRTLYVIGDDAQPNLVAVYLADDRRNLNVVYRAGEAATATAREEQFAARLVRRVVVVGGSLKDRVAVGSVPPLFKNGVLEGTDDKVPADEVVDVSQDLPYDTEAVIFKDAVSNGERDRMRPGTRVEIYGKAGNDVLIGGHGRDRIYGGEGDDVLVGLAAIDVLDGGAGNDQLEGGNGADRLFGGADLDSINLAGGSHRADLISGGAGTDIIDFVRGIKLRDRVGDDIIQDRAP
jgi:Ca2+-binding RTX toxin-like protein